MTRPHRCTYTKPDQTPCRAFAAGRSRLCYWHGRQAARDRRRTRALNRGCTVRIGSLNTHRAILNAVNRVLQPLAAGTLPVDRASRYLRRIHLAAFALEPPTAPLEPQTHLPSPIHPPTINQVPAIRRSSQPAVNKPTHHQAERPTGAPEREQHTQDDHHARP